MNRKNKVILLIGASGSGKSTIEHKFLTEDSYKYGNFNHIISYATREKRLGEINGIDYYFVNDKEFNDISEKGEFAQIIEHAGTKKGSTFQEWEDKLNIGNVIIPVLLSSAIEIKKNLSSVFKDIEKDIHIIFFDIEKEIILSRILNRYLPETKYTIDELYYMYYNNITHNDDSLSKIFQDISIRLNDIELLKDTKKYTNNIIGISPNDNIDDVYIKFIGYIDEIFK